MPLLPQPEWLQPAAEIVAREGLTLAEALTRLAVPLKTSEIANTWRSKAFQRVLRSESNRYYSEMGQDPSWVKATAVGQLLHCAAQLIKKGEYDKGAEVILKAAKVQGWLSAEAQVNVFAGLSGREMEEVRKRILEQSGSSVVGAGDPKSN